MKKWIFIGVGIFLLVVFAVAAVVLPKVAQLKRAALKVAADNEARERQFLEDNMPMPMPEEGEMGFDSSEDIPTDFLEMMSDEELADVSDSDQLTTDPTTEGNGAVAWISDPDNPQNVLVEQKIRFKLNKPTGALTEADLEKVEQLTFVLKLNDEGLKELAKLKRLKVLLLVKTNITDAGLREMAKLPELRSLTISGADITNVGLKELAKLPSLVKLGLPATQITDEGLKELAKLKDLYDVNLKGTKVTEAGVAQLQKALPNCTIDH